MNRPAFTLIEMMVAVVIAALLFTALYSVSDTLRHTIDRYTLRGKKEILPATRLQKLVTLDIQEADPKAIFLPADTTDDGIRLLFHTRHSLHHLGRVWVGYYLMQGRLLRTETPCDRRKAIYRDILRCTPYVDLMYNGVTLMHTYINPSKNGTAVLFVIDKNSKKEIWPLHPFRQKIDIGKKK